MAVSTNASRSQWIDLGIQAEACMTRPQTCGEAGGAVSMWVKVINCPVGHGIIGTNQVELSNGLVVDCLG